jgi:hypothetical protein
MLEIWVWSPFSVLWYWALVSNKRLVFTDFPQENVALGLRLAVGELFWKRYTSLGWCPPRITSVRCFANPCTVNRCPAYPTARCMYVCLRLDCIWMLWTTMVEKNVTQLWERMFTKTQQHTSNDLLTFKPCGFILGSCLVSCKHFICREVIVNWVILKQGHNLTFWFLFHSSN